MSITYTATYSPDDNKLRLYASSRLDSETYARVKAAGFSWAPKQELFVAPAWSPSREDLLLELAGEIDDEDKSLVERAEERAERFEDYSDNRREDANQAHAAVAAIADGIPFGQPILVGHHSEKHARKDAQRIENGMRKAVKMWETSKYWKSRAAGAVAAAKYKELPAVRARRIKAIEADLRRVMASFTPHLWESGPRAGEVQRIMQQDFYERYPANGPSNPDAPEIPHVWVGPKGRGGHWVAEKHLEGIKARSERWIEHYSNRLEYERAMLQEAIGVDDHGLRFDFQIGGKITVSRESAILTILKLNKKDGQLISVSTNSRRWTRVVPVEDIKEYTPPEDGAAEQIKAATKRQGPCNYPGEGFATCTLETWKKINKDYKSTIHRIEAADTHAAHCVRWALGVYLTIPPAAAGDKSEYRRHNYYPVYITDEKRKDPPKLDATPAAPTVPPVAHDDAAILADLERRKAYSDQREAEKATAAPFDALRESLKTGVQVVIAPQLFPTPPAICQRMVDIADLDAGQRILEPSAGTGNICDAINDAEGMNIELVAIEINPTFSQCATREGVTCSL